MARQLCIIIALFLAASLFATGDRYEQIVLFEKDRSELTPAGITHLETFLSTLPMSGDQQFMVDGHTDSDGSRNYNETLSRARALSVQEFLLEKGIAPDLIMLEHYGERSPVAPNEDEESMSLNRRVTVTYVHHRLSTTKDMNEALMERKVQRFMIDPMKDEQIQGAEGTMIRFNAGILVDGNGRPVQGPVEVQLTEALDLQSMVANELSTRSGDRLIETGGMLKLEAFNTDGDLLALRSGGNVEIAVPAAMPLDGMELFLSDDGSDWSTTGQDLTVSSMEWFSTGGPIFSPPLRPSTTIPFNMPRYKEDQTGRPNMPTMPERPIMPNRPRKESYAITTKWWKPWTKEKVERTSDRWYDEAMARFDRKMEKYERKLAYYEEHLAGYDEKMDRYKERMLVWEIQKKDEYDNWCRTIRDEAIRDHALAVDANAGNADSLIAAWQREYDDRRNDWIYQQQEYRDSVATAMDLNSSATLTDLNGYVFSSGKLGWINCDRFWNYPPSGMHEFVVKNEDPGHQLMLIFEDINSVLTLYPDANGERRSGPVPREQKITLFAYTVIDGRAHLCVQPVKGSTIPELKFEPSSMVEVTKRLNEIRQTSS